MASTLNPTLTLTSSDAFTSSLSLSTTKAISLSDNGKLRNRQVYSPDDVDPGGVKVFSTAFGKSYLYVKNVHASLIIYLQAAADTAESAVWMELAAGEFAFFPWAGVADLFASTGDNGAGAAANGLEVMIFEA